MGRGFADTVGWVDERWTPRRQGDAGELSAMCWLASQGASLFIPVGHSRHVDLIADFGDTVVRVQVKTTRFWRRDRWETALCSAVGTRAGTGW